MEAERGVQLLRSSHKGMDSNTSANSIETRATPLRLPDGSIGQLAISRDVTQRQQDERRIREGEHRYKEMLQALPLAIYTTDLDGRITFFNEAAVEFAGRRPALGEQWCVTWRLYHPDGAPMPHDQCPMAIALKERRAVRGMEGIAERPDGTRVRFTPYPTPLLDSEGHVFGAINVLVDQSDQHQMHATAARLASIVESSDDAIVSKDLDGIITSWNEGARRIFGYEPAEIIGEPITRIIPPELHDEEREILARLRRGERIDHFETVRVAKGGGRVDISLTVSPLRDKLGNVVGASKVARDISERKQAERLQRLLLDELNHRVKNTLAIIQAISSQSLRHAKSQSDFVASFSGRVQALARAHDLLTATKLQGADLGELVREQVMLGRGEDDKRIACSGPRLMLDSQMTVHLALVLHELAANARKYGALSAPQGRLAINWEMRANGRRCLQLTWEESNGPKVTAPTERGFGSMLIERTLRGHGGEAMVRYNVDGLVCEISFPLPEQVQPDAPSGADRPGLEAMQDGHSSLSGKRVVIIEDEPLVSMELESMLTAAGCAVVATAGTIEKAEALVARAECDAALLDLNLGGHSVVDLAEKLTARRVPFAFVSGYGSAGLPQEFHNALVVPKPVSNGELLAALEHLMRERRGTAA